MTPPSLAQIDVVADRAAARLKPQRRKLARALAACWVATRPQQRPVVRPADADPGPAGEIEDGDDAEARHVAKP